MLVLSILGSCDLLRVISLYRRCWSAATTSRTRSSCTGSSAGRSPEWRPSRPKRTGSGQRRAWRERLCAGATCAVLCCGVCYCLHCFVRSRRHFAPICPGFNGCNSAYRLARCYCCCNSPLRCALGEFEHNCSRSSSPCFMFAPQVAIGGAPLRFRGHRRAAVRLPARDSPRRHQPGRAQQRRQGAHVSLQLCCSLFAGCRTA
jgi:hypothetical protein